MTASGGKRDERQCKNTITHDGRIIIKEKEKYSALIG